jgi:2,3-bisphosphoglycerate-independent phosphoglycerate mutase
VHFITDGRDAGPYSSPFYLKRLEKVFKKYEVGRVGSIMGRYWIMDRDHRWDRVEAGYNAVVHGLSEYKATSAKKAIENAYVRAKKAESENINFVESDEFIKPTVIVDKKGEPVGKVKDKDGFIWVNFRTDRSIEISQALSEKKFVHFKRGKNPDIFFAGTFRYYPKMKSPVAFVQEIPKNTLGEMVSKAGLKQFRVTETEKWIYVTTIFSGMRSEPFKGEDRVLIPSDIIESYDLQPKMHAMDIAKETVKAINSGKYELIFLNINNPDIIGHTGKIDKAIIAIEECDKAVGLIVEAVRKNNGLAVISADHGNVEEMLTKKGEVDTNHSINKVPFIIVNDDPEYNLCSLRKNGALKDVTPTILDILKVKKPKEMTGESLLIRCEK